MEDATFEGVVKRIANVIGSKSQKDLANALEISEQAVSKGLKRDKIPSTWVYKIAGKYGVTPEWLLFGREPMSRPPIDTALAFYGKASTESECVNISLSSWKPPVFIAPPPNMDPWKNTRSQEVPVIGLGSCGKIGWYSPEQLALRIVMPVDYPYTPTLFGVLAVGKSMQPEGIRQGFVLFCNPEANIETGDVVFVELKNNLTSVKKFLKIEKQEIHLQGWNDPAPDGTQTPYFEVMAMENVKRMSCVIAVKRKA